MKLRDLGLPFDNWRPYQLEAVEWAKASLNGGKFILLEAPTGSGKSIIGLALAKLLGRKVIYLVATKQLQEQLRILAGEVGWLAMLMGRNEYLCLLHKEASAEDCTYNPESPCEFAQECPYRIAKARALAKDVAVLNYSYFLTEANYVGAFSRDSQLVICDEVDLLEDRLTNFVGVTITAWARERYGMGKPGYKTKPTAWQAWAEAEQQALRERLARLEARGIAMVRELREANRLRSLIADLSRLAKYADESWVFLTSPSRSVEGVDDFTFRPVWVSGFAPYSFWRHGALFLGMSATIGAPDILSQGLGIECTSFQSLPSTFPSERYPIYYWGAGNLSRKSEQAEFPKVVDALERLLDHYPHKKGLCHTVSHNRTERIKQAVPSDRWLTPARGEDGRREIEEFKKSPEPKVLLSPALERGIDLPYEACEWIVLVKTPFPDLSDRAVSRRLYSGTHGKQWYQWETARRVVQSSGRGMRSPDDWCEVWILDSGFEDFATNSWSLFPEWFKGRIQRRQL